MPVIGSGGGWITMKAGVMNLKRVHPIDVHKVYVESLAEWIEVPVFDQEEVIKLVNDIDWEGLDMRQYKKTLVEHWPGLSTSVRAKSKNPATRDELYEILLQENWGLSPKSALQGSEFLYTKIESDNVLAWFASNKIKGRAPRVLSNG